MCRVPRKPIKDDQCRPEFDVQEDAKTPAREHADHALPMLTQHNTRFRGEQTRARAETLSTRTMLSTSCRLSTEARCAWNVLLRSVNGSPAGPDMLDLVGNVSSNMSLPV